jgi:hydrogenase maturation factor
MNLHYAHLIGIAEEKGVRLGIILTGGAKKKVPLDLLTDAVPGDKVLICDGMAIGKVAQPPLEEKEDVLGDSRETH